MSTLAVREIVVNDTYTYAAEMTNDICNGFVECEEHGGAARKGKVFT